MDVSGLDINQTLEYRCDTTVVRLLPTGLLLIFLGLVIFVLVDLDREPWTFIGIVLCWVMGAGLVGFTLWRRSNRGKPIFTLAPDGIHYRIPLVKKFLIPWHEIQGVDTIDIEAGYWSILWSTETFRYHTFVVRDVTVVLLPKPFYDKWIHVDFFFLRGPAWKANFIPSGDLVQMALHHEFVSVEPKPLREAVEARWLAFRERPATALARTSVPSVGPGASTSRSNASKAAAPTSSVIAMGKNPKSMSRWEATKIIVLLIGIATASANLAGLWHLPGEAKVNEARAKAREERRYWEESARKRKEESRKLEADDKKRQQEFEEDMRRAFGR
jgi:hypothetical protein